MKQELRALTSMRGLAAWAVVLFHIRQSIAGLPPTAEALLAKGYLAVDFFFLLSGFVIWLSAGETLRTGGGVAVARFLRRRVARVWPLHLFMMGCAVLLALALLATGRQPEQFPWGALPLHLLLVQNWGFTGALAWNDPAWSISCEVAAYLLFPLFVRAVDWRRTPSSVIVAAVAGLLVLLHALYALSGEASLGAAIPRLGLLRCLLEFAAGTGVGALWLRWRDRRGVATRGLLLGVALLAAVALGRLPETFAVPAGFAALLLALALTAGRPGNPLDAAPLHYLGEISYATYLGHFLLWFAFKLALVDAGGTMGPALLALYLLLVFASSAALYHLVERPAQRWVNRLAVPRARFAAG
ncbi:acyltransferase family protein [Sphingomonas sp. S2-65]|uniref:acyltransferase family protein n=1 Tax=Sphingomonas sp. S2-65 TaxID=2903960 RepID=UPI001F3AAAAB|nr:acyltransferase [Sphingomonas sp. S2-65]UYY59807.1 acyltransferase [Sphingomonas sp. S2-65]